MSISVNFFAVTLLTFHQDFNRNFHVRVEVAGKLHLSKWPFAEGIEYDVVICKRLLFIGAGLQAQLPCHLLSHLASKVLDNFHANANWENQINNNKK